MQSQEVLFSTHGWTYWLCLHLMSSMQNVLHFESILLLGWVQRGTSELNVSDSDLTVSLRRTFRTTINSNKVEVIQIWTMRRVIQIQGQLSNMFRHLERNVKANLNDKYSAQRIGATNRFSLPAGWLRLVEHKQDFFEESLQPRVLWSTSGITK